MSVSSDTLALLMSSGLSGDALLAVVRSVEADMAAMTSGSKDATAEKRRAYDRDRKRNSGGISGGKAADHSGGNSGGIPPETAALTRVRDITSTSVDRPNHTILDVPPEFSADVSWPESDPPSKPDLDRLTEALTDAAGPALASVATSPGLIVLAPILRLARSGKGPPCDLQTDVLPTIRARSARAPPGSVKSWEFYVSAITEARDKRLSGAPQAQPIRPANDRQPSYPDARKARFVEHYGGIADAMAAAVEQPAG